MTLHIPHRLAQSLIVIKDGPSQQLALLVAILSRLLLHMVLAPFAALAALSQGHTSRHRGASMIDVALEIAFGTIAIVVVAYLFSAFYPLVGGTSGVVATVLTNATSPGYVGATFVPLANLIPIVYVIAVIVTLVFMALGLLLMAKHSASGATGYFS